MRILDEESPPWYWGNCRSIGFSAWVWPLDWHWGIERSGDVYGMEYRLEVGPFVLAMHVNIGDPNRWCGGLCEEEAYDRAMKKSNRRRQ